MLQSFYLLYYNALPILSGKMNVLGSADIKDPHEVSNYISQTKRAR